jgi:predicted DCC family thiol-disulfide oxidoreductase YuxK
VSSAKVHIVLFDGICNLCDRTVRWIIRHDKENKFHFIALQSETGQTLLSKLYLSDKDSNSVVYINHTGIFTRSAAALHILKDIGNGWQLLFAFRIIPKCLRDGIYRLIAGTRYQIFGKKEYCEIPDDRHANQFHLSDEEISFLNQLTE